MRLFITGIGTDVGKTMVSAILAEALQADYWKPVQSGNSQSVDSQTVRSLISNSKTVIYPEAYSFSEPVSPHLAARLENVSIDLEEIHLPRTSNHLIIEGAGGLLVPLNTKNYAIDLAKTCEAEVVLVIRNYLGCINHSLLSLDYLLKHGFTIKGIVLNGNFEPAIKEAITAYADVKIIAEIPDLKTLDKHSIRQQALLIYL